MAQNPARPVGRPREFDVTVSVRLRAARHDEMSKEALRRGVDLAEVIRERLNFVSRNSSEADKSAY